MCETNNEEKFFLTSPELIKPTERLTTVAWDQLRAISKRVQEDLQNAGMDEHDEYATVIDMWENELKDALEEDQEEGVPIKWYTYANNYWEDEEKCSLDEEGVLGGHAYVSFPDITGSQSFLDEVQRLRPQCKREYAADCGAGIGRVSKFFLLPEFDHVDLIEQSERLLRGSFNYVRIPNLQERMRHLFCMGLQDFDPTPNTYDVIWIQWVLPHLHDLDLVNFLRKCQQALRPNGWICIKENVILEGTPFEIDKEDSSVTRSEAYYKSIFEQAGLELIHEKKQQGFPDELYPVKMYALI